MVWTADAVAGALIGGAIGDALGACCEGRGPDPTRCLPERGQITDHTQLTLATCEALMQAGGVDLPTIAARYVAWYCRWTWRPFVSTAWRGKRTRAIPAQLNC